MTNDLFRERPYNLRGSLHSPPIPHAPRLWSPFSRDPISRMTAHLLSAPAPKSIRTYCLAKAFAETRTCIERSNILGTCTTQVSSPELIYSRSLLGSSKEQDTQRHFVLSSDTLVVLELDFTPSPSHSLIFDALKVPLTRSVKCSVESRGRRLLSLQIILVDATIETFVRGQSKEGDQAVALSPVDFQAEHNIIDLRDGGVTVRFKLPCCFLDSKNRTGCYR